MIASTLRAHSLKQNTKNPKKSFFFKSGGLTLPGLQGTQEAAPQLDWKEKIQQKACGERSLTSYHHRKNRHNLGELTYYQPNQSRIMKSQSVTPCCQTLATQCQYSTGLKNIRFISNFPCTCLVNIFSSWRAYLSKQVAVLYKPNCVCAYFCFFLVKQS